MLFILCLWSPLDRALTELSMQIYSLFPYFTLQIVLNVFENKYGLISGIGLNFTGDYCNIGACISLVIF